MRNNKFFISMHFFILALFLSLSCHGQSDLSIKVNRLSERVAVFECLDVNSTAIVSSKGIIIIDTNRSPGIMKEIKKRIEAEFGRNDFLYVINTHGHYDHSSGNQIFPNSMIIGHENCPKFMQQSPANSLPTISYLKYCLSDLKAKFKESKRNSDDAKRLRAEIAAWAIVMEDLEKKYIVTPPSKTFRDSLNLDLGDLTLKLIYAGKAHTDHDIFVYIPEEKLVLTGDIFNSKSSLGFYVNKMNDVPQMISAINQILQCGNEIKYVLPGHGDVFSGEDLISLRDLLKEKFDGFEGRNKKSAAGYLEKLIEAHGLKLALQKYDEFKSMPKSDYYFLEQEFNILGNRLLDGGMVDAAIGIFKLTLERFPNSALAYIYLAEAYLKKGEIQLAIKNYEKSLQIFPENRPAREILKTLREG